MPHSRDKLIQDMRIACADISAFCAGRTYEEFSQDRLLQAGVERKLEVLGEALRRLSEVDAK